MQKITSGTLRFRYHGWTGALDALSDNYAAFTQDLRWQALARLDKTIETEIGNNFPRGYR